MTKKILKISGIVLTLILLIFVVPILINESYKRETGYLTLWSANDVLSYYGTLLACIGGVLGVFFTVKYSQKQYREDARQRIMPFVATDFLLNKSCYKDFAEKHNQYSIEDKNEYDHFVITYSNDKGVQYPIFLSEEECSLLDNNGHFEVEDKKNGITLYGFKIICFIPCVLKNVGTGVALKTTFGLYKLNNGCYSEKIDDRKASKPFVLDKGDRIHVGLYFDLDDEESLGTYKFDIMYSDTDFTRYRRSITFKFIQNPQTKVIEYERTDSAEHTIYSVKEKKHNG